jgi:hypothetical protein
MSERLVFAPRPSRGWLSLAVLGCVFLGACIFLVTQSGAQDVSNSMITVIAVVCGAFALLYLSLALWFPTMYYELKDDALEMHYGPLLNYSIPLQNILTIGTRDLKMSPWSSLRLPGVALFGVPYRGLGQVRMCATSAAHDIVLIETARAKYGLTPADEDLFIAEVDARRHSKDGR